MFAQEPDIPKKLRALWALHAIGAADETLLLEQLHHDSEYLRAWAARLLCENGGPSSAALDRFAVMAADDDSPYVRLHLASLLQRVPAAERWPIARGLLTHAADAEDDNIPLMIWYGVEPLVQRDVGRFLALAAGGRIPLVARFAARRAASLPDNAAALASLVTLLQESTGEISGALVAGCLEGLEGRRTVAMPAGWSATFRQLQASASEDVREQSLQLALIFDDPVALETLRRRAGDRNASAASRQRSIAGLVAKQAADTAPLLLELIDDPATRPAAIRGLAEFDHPQTAEALLARYADFDADAKQDAIQTLAARPAWALRLLDAVADGRIARTDVSAYSARQLLSLQNETVTARVEAVWGRLRSTPAEKQQLIGSYKRRLPAESLGQADRSLGRAVFEKTCAKCHRFFDAGGQIGPNITGSQRTNLDYLLETIIDPSAAIGRDYQLQVLETTGGRVISGLVVDEGDTAVTVQTVNEPVVVPTAEIDTRTTSSVSMMPEGILQTLSTEEIRALFAYLMGPDQVALPAGAAAGE